MAAWERVKETFLGNEDEPAAWRVGARGVGNFLEDARAFLTVTATGPLAQPVCFVHVPKCAGTTVDSAIRRTYRSVWEMEGESIHKLDPRAADRVAEATGESKWDIRRNTVAYYLAQSDTRYASGHFQVTSDFLDRFEDDYAFVTLLRHPVDRWISHYWFNTYKTPDHEYYIGQEIEEFLETDRARGIGQIFLAYFSGRGDIGPEERENSEEILAEAKSNLRRMDLVGFVEEMDGFGRDFEEMFGTKLNLMRRNVSPASDEEKNVSPGIREKIREVCWEDIELYEAAVREFGGK